MLKMIFYYVFILMRLHMGLSMFTYFTQHTESDPHTVNENVRKFSHLFSLTVTTHNQKKKKKLSFFFLCCFLSPSFYLLLLLLLVALPHPLSLSPHSYICIYLNLSIYSYSWAWMGYCICTGSKNKLDVFLQTSGKFIQEKQIILGL